MNKIVIKVVRHHKTVDPKSFMRTALIFEKKHIQVNFITNIRPGKLELEGNIVKYIQSQFYPLKP